MSEPERWVDAHGTADVEAIMAEIERRVGASEGSAAAARARELRHQLLGDPDEHFTAEECEILPRDYVIDHHVPLLGPVHSVVRRLVNAEIGRYLEPGLRRQARLNRWLLDELRSLREENRALRAALAGRDDDEEA